MNFARLASTVIHRSKFVDRPKRTFTFNAGDLVPIGKPFLVYPGDTFKIKPNIFLRFSSPFVTPVLDDAYVDTFWFFVPMRLLWSHWQNFMGESDTPYDPDKAVTNEYLIPTLVAPAGGFGKGSLADYYMVNPYVQGVEVSALYFRGYNLIYNEWFRRQSIQPALPVPSEEIDSLDNYSLRKRVKRRDYFTTGLPWPQRGPDVGLNLSGDIPVVGNGNGIQFVGGGRTLSFQSNFSPTNNGTGISAFFPYDTPVSVDATTTGTRLGSFNNPLGISTDPSKSGLIGKLSAATMITVTELRNAFQVQKLYEKDARGGTRYTEIIRMHFGTVSSDARLQRPEYLGGSHQRININTVVQNSSSTTSDSDPLGTLAAFGVGVDRSNGFTQSFTEHGLIFGLINVYCEQSYQQGIPREMMYQTRLDFYWPVFAHLSEEPIFRGELFATGTETDREAFAYNERYAVMRYEPSGVMGEFRSDAKTPLDMWHFAQDFKDNPTLSPAFIEDASQEILDRCLQVSSSVSDQILASVELNLVRIRPLPEFGTPGFVDHF